MSKSAIMVTVYTRENEEGKMNNTYKEEVTAAHINAAQERANRAYESAKSQDEAYRLYRREMEFFNNAVRFNDLYVELTPRQMVDDPEFKKLNFFFLSHKMNIQNVHQYLRDLVGTKHHGS